jgi:hypothetical protein
METFFTTPFAMMRVGSVPLPHFKDGQNSLNLDQNQLTQIEDCFLHTLELSKTVLMTASLQGYQVPYLFLTEVMDTSVTDFRLDMKNQEISIFVTSRSQWQPPEGGLNQNGILVTCDLQVNSRLDQAMALTEFPWGNQQSQMILCFLPTTTKPLYERLVEVEKGIFETTTALELTISMWLDTYFDEELIQRQPSTWIRQENHGLFAIYDFTCWDKEPILEVLGVERVSTVGREVWERRMEDKTAFVAFLKRELGLEESGSKSSVLQLMKTLDAERSTQTQGQRPVKLIEHIQSWPYLWDACVGEDEKGAVSIAELKHLTYTEVLMLMHEAGVFNILAFTSILDGPALREMIRLGIDGWERQTQDGINKIASWAVTNYDDLAMSLAGDIIPSYLTGQLHNLASNTTGTVMGGIAGSFFSPGVGTFVGGAVGFLISDLWGMIVTSQGSLAEQMAAVEASQRVMVLSRALRDAVAEKQQAALAYEEARAQDLRDMAADPEVSDKDIKDYYTALLQDLDNLEYHAGQLHGDLSLAQAYLRLWVIERGWGLYEPSFNWYEWPYWWPTGVSSETNFVAFTNNRTRILGLWRTSYNPTLYIDQCEFEWKSLGLDCDDFLTMLRSTSTNNASTNLANFQNVQVTFRELKIPARWEHVISDITQVNQYPPGVSFLWDKKLQNYAHALVFPKVSTINNLNTAGEVAISVGNFELRCNLELAVTNGCCHVERFHYRYQWDHTDYAYKLDRDTGSGTGAVRVPVDFFECWIRPDMPKFS